MPKFRILTGDDAGLTPVALARRRLSRFGRDEEGSMIVFSMFLLIMMLIVGGMAVDLMRYESTRARLQATLDRAVLAAADLDQNLDPEMVVTDYFEISGLLDQLTSITVTEAINSRSVEATATMDVDTMFMHMLGIDTLAAPAGGTAIEAVSDIEIMLVLDVSGSMANNNRLINLRTAANEFVQTVLQDDTERRISIGIVPFNGQVNLGATLRARYNVTDLTGVADANCVDLPAAAYANLDLATTLSMPQTAHADTFSPTTRSNQYYSISSNVPTATNRWCPPSTGNIVRLPTTSISQLQARINALHAVGATSINAGMRWGTELLHPGSRPMFGTLIASSAMTSDINNRPYDFGRDNTMKVIVLMTDGEHFAEERVNAGYRSGTAPIWRSNDADAFFSIFHASRVVNTNATTICNSRPYWVPHLGVWHSRPWTGTAPSGTACYSATTATWTGTTRQTWPQVWNAVRMHWVAYQLYGRPLGTTTTERENITNTWMNNFRTLTPTTAMDTQLATLCEDARDEGVVIFGIAFEAPANGEAAIASCASSPSHYFDAAGVQITQAFRAIAGQISMLRLIQ